jgi:hypothetical protein
VGDAEKQAKQTKMDGFKAWEKTQVSYTLNKREESV